MPDCERKMKIGDPSILSHQHINYFTKNSLTRLLQLSGLKKVRVISSNNVAMLFGWGVKVDKPAKVTANNNERKIFQQFSRNFFKNIQAVQKIVDKAETQGKTLGLYGDCTILRGMVKFQSEPRVYEGDDAKWGKLMITSNKRFESPTDLVKNPVDVLIVTPIDYDAEIKKNLKRIGLNTKTQIVSLKKIYEGESKFRYRVRSNKINTVTNLQV